MTGVIELSMEESSSFLCKNKTKQKKTTKKTQKYVCRQKYGKIGSQHTWSLGSITFFFFFFFFFFFVIDGNYLQFLNLRIIEL